MMIIRPIKEREVTLLSEFVYEAIFQDSSEKLAPRMIIQYPSIWIYIDEFGKRKDDHCFVAEVDGKIVGAVWTRCIKVFVHIDDAVPEFAISVYPEYRKQGIGRELMIKMLDHLRKCGYKKASLAVQKVNYAEKLYRAIGFEVIETTEQEYIMMYNLK